MLKPVPRPAPFNYQGIGAPKKQFLECKPYMNEKVKVSQILYLHGGGGGGGWH